MRTDTAARDSESVAAVPPKVVATVTTLFWLYASFTRLTQWELLRLGNPNTTAMPLDLGFLVSALLLPVLLALVFLARRIAPDWTSWRRAVPVHVGFAIVFGLCEHLCLAAAWALLHDTTFMFSLARLNGATTGNTLRVIAYMIFDDGSQYIVLQALLAGVAFYVCYRDEQQRRTLINAQYERARLHTLRMQINPHFLFNTLSAIAGLVRVNPAAAENMVTRLGDIFRRTLAERDAEFVPLRQELELSRQYLEIQRERFPERLHYNLQLDRAAESAAIPPLLLQPLLENAIEHGLNVSEGHSNIDVACTLAGGAVTVSVRNASEQPIVGAERHRHGIGLDNVRERLDAAFGRAGSFECSSPGPGEFVVRLSFPQRPAALAEQGGR